MSRSNTASRLERCYRVVVSGSQPPLAQVDLAAAVSGVGGQPRSAQPPLVQSDPAVAVSGGGGRPRSAQSLGDSADARGDIPPSPSTSPEPGDEVYDRPPHPNDPRPFGQVYRVPQTGLVSTHGQLIGTLDNPIVIDVAVPNVGGAARGEDDEGESPWESLK